MQLRLDIARDPTAPGRARRAVRGLRDRLDPDVLSDVTLLVSELVSNSVKYGTGKVGLRVRVRSSRQVLVEVVDGGNGFDPSVPRSSRSEPGGFGLKLVDAIASRWGVRDGHTHVWFEIDRSADLAFAA